MQNLYKITITDWSQHNVGKKNTYKKTLISNNIVSEARILALPSSHRWLYISLLLICGDSACGTITLTERQLNEQLAVRVGASNALDALQSFQLLSYEKIASKERKKEVKKERSKESNLGSSENEIQKIEIPEKNNDAEQNKKIWESYLEAYQLRYRVIPKRNAQINSQVSNLRKKIGLEESIQLVQFYLTHNDSFYLKNTHTFGHCLRDCETLRTQMLKGKAITTTMVRQHEKTEGHRNVMDRIDKEGI